MNTASKGYYGSIEVSVPDKVFHGRVLGITGLISYEGHDYKSLKEDFDCAVDDYIEICKEHKVKAQIADKEDIEKDLNEIFQHFIVQIMQEV